MSAAVSWGRYLFVVSACLLLKWTNGLANESSCRWAEPLSLADYDGLLNSLRRSWDRYSEDVIRERDHLLAGAADVLSVSSTKKRSSCADGGAPSGSCSGGQPLVDRFARHLRTRASRATEGLELNARTVLAPLVDALEAGWEATADVSAIMRSGKCDLETDDALHHIRSDAHIWRHRDIPACATISEKTESSSSHNVDGIYMSFPDVLGHLVRDWSFPVAETTVASYPTHALDDRAAGFTSSMPGSVDQHYGAVVAALHDHVFGQADAMNAKKQTVRSVLVPGSGAGGLVHRIRTAANAAGQRLHVVATECAPAMLALMRWMLFPRGGNDPAEAPSTRSFVPWMSAFSNQRLGTEDDQFARYEFNRDRAKVEDEVGAARRTTTTVDVIYGDVFAEVVPDPQHRLVFDVVVLSYILDAAARHHPGRDGTSRSSSSLLRTLRRIDQLVSPEGGLLLFMGPLQYHDAAIEPKLSSEEVILYFTDVLEGYEMVEGPQCVAHPAAYTQVASQACREASTTRCAGHANARLRGMGWLIHAPDFFVLRKRQHGIE